MTALNKYRPSLTAKQIQHIVSLAKREQPISNNSLSLLSVLSPFLAKIENAGIMPAYTLAPTTHSKASLASSAFTLSSLGLDSLDKVMEASKLSIAPNSELADSRPLEDASLSKQEQWEACFIKYVEDIDACTLPELQGAQEWRYLNDLMSPEEMAAFERAN